jgi:hypothetical protein
MFAGGSADFAGKKRFVIFRPENIRSGKPKPV